MESDYLERDPAHVLRTPKKREALPDVRLLWQRLLGFLVVGFFEPAREAVGELAAWVGGVDGVAKGVCVGVGGAAGDRGRFVGSVQSHGSSGVTPLLRTLRTLIVRQLLRNCVR